jgi:hypothetical protein
MVAGCAVSKHMCLDPHLPDYSSRDLVFHSYIPGNNLLFYGGKQQSNLQSYLLADFSVRLVSFAGAT